MKNILIDCDDVLLDWHNGFTKFLWSREIYVDPAGPDEWNMDKWVGAPSRPLIEEFNASPEFGRLEPLLDAVATLKTLHVKGFTFTVITSAGTTQQLKTRRQTNIKKHFGEMVTSIVILPLGADKSVTLRKYPSTYWIEDNFQNALAGVEAGHRTFCLRKRHNQVFQKTPSKVRWIDNLNELVSRLN